MRLAPLARGFAAVSLLLGGCAAEPTEEAGDSTDSAILQGTKSTTAHPAVGSLVDTWGSNDCTGTLIAANVVLTAAHCFQGPSSLGFQPGAYGKTKKTYLPLPISADPYNPDFVVHPHYDGETGAHDLAYIVLAEAVPGITPATIGSTKGAVGSCELDAVGYGQVTVDDTTATTTGTRKIAKMCLAGTNANGLLVTKGVDGSPCHGDSGGGLMKHGEANDVIVGVVHGGGGDGVCRVGGEALYVPLDGESAFLAAALAAGKKAAKR